MEHFNSSDRLPNSIEEALFNDYYLEEWCMTEAERCTLIMLLNKIRPECSIEIGTYRGGSLSALSRFSKKVYALDIDPGCSKRLGEKFGNVEFITGPSQETLPPLLEQLLQTGVGLEFVLVDGDHSRNGIKRDIENLLAFRPNRTLYVIIHDSFNPECRQGMLEADWAGSPYVHFVEIDFVPGHFPSHPDYYRQMWCGFALVLFFPKERKKLLKINSNEELLFQTVLKHSIYGDAKLNFLRLFNAYRKRVKRYLRWAQP